MTNNPPRRLALLGCLDVAEEILRRLVDRGVPIGAVIGLSPDHAEKWGVSGYRNLESLAAGQAIPFHFVHRYDLKSESDVSLFADCRCDALMVAGWTRLVPEAILKLFPLGCFGVHGSAELLPRGRGRSPINWSLIEDRKRFVIHLFRLSPGVDDGDVVALESFDIFAWDDCRTLYMKNAIATSRMMVRTWETLAEQSGIMVIPQEGEPTFYPKRTAEDGKIDWSRPLASIHNLVRAVTRPYPGAFSHVEGARVTIWRAQSFDTRMLYPGAPLGMIVEHFSSGEFVVNCPDGLLLVSDFECDRRLVTGIRLG